MSEFIQQNPSLGNLQIYEHGAENEQEAYFSLEDMYEKMNSNKPLGLIYNYVISTVKFMANLCKGRYLRAIKSIKLLGIN